MTIDREQAGFKVAIANFRKECSSWEIFDETELNMMSSIIKKITFLAVIKNRYAEDTYFLQSLLSDLIFTISTFELKQERYFYFNLRSAIENYLRFILRKPHDDKTGVRNLFNEFESKNKLLKDELNSQYAICCNYVHNHKDASLILTEVYSQIKTTPFINIRNAIERLHNVLGVFLKYLIFTKKEVIDYSFHRNKSGMKYLLGDSLFQKYRFESLPQEGESYLTSGQIS
ncbi:hypothetical protein NYR79_07615 [Actinobacillus equuli subsp. haemolyticus]|uniref:hypothetical protein n=1 Tax=Actinobacillus equuli TaxID=718 RepID=UPI002442346B|nr:hypothetical protein [Actinobacillus equuli]WGE70718.1 hypothetical protein NYR79_07615 [Actinobacillus equuli subsp. haemolyticus]